MNSGKVPESTFDFETLESLPRENELLQLQATLPSKNIKRFYSILSGKDLFGDGFIKVNYGRIGKGGVEREFLFKNDLDHLRALKRIIRKRLNAKNRIGTDYRLVSEWD